MNEDEYRNAMEQAWSLTWPVLDRLGRLAFCFGLANRLTPPPAITFDYFKNGQLRGRVTWRARGETIEQSFADMEDLKSILSYCHDIQDLDHG